MQKYVNDIATVVGGPLAPLASASCAVYLTGTSTLASIYSDNGVTALTNPTTSSDTGRLQFYAADGRYDIVVTKPGFNSTTITDVLLEDPATSSDLQYLPAGAGAVTRGIQGKLRETVSVTDFGAVGDGVADDTLTIRDEGTIVGGANSISTLNFVGSIVSVASTAGIATITFASASAGEFNTGITSSVQIKPLSFESSVFTFPSTAGKQYVIETINVANVDTSVGIGTTVNIIASIQDSTGEQTYIAYNIPIVTGGLIELLKNPIVAGPSDVIRMWSTNGSYSGVSTALEVYMNYDEYTSTEYIRKYASTVSIATTNITGIFTSTTYASVIKSIHLANRTDSGDYPVSVTITNGVTTTFLAKDLIIPRYSTVDILDRPKRVELNGKISIGVGQTSTIDVIIAGKQITS